MSKPVKIWSLLYYLTEIEGLTWRQVDYTTNKMIKAIKGQQINGYLELKVGGQIKSFKQGNVSELVDLLRCEAGGKIAAETKDDFCIVPIPNSSAVVGNTAEFRTLADARAIAAVVGARASAVPALRWRTAKQPAHDGGSRDLQTLFDNLVVVQKPERPVILFDDVQTTGSQMIACYRKLAEIDCVPLLGMVVGRATKEQKEPALGWHAEDVETEEVAFDWGAFFTKEV